MLKTKKQKKLFWLSNAGFILTPPLIYVSFCLIIQQDIVLGISGERHMLCSTQNVLSLLNPDNVILA
jgi:hypothetical protein